MKKILLPYDGSESAQHAVNHVINTIKGLPHKDVEVHLLHICEPLNVTTDHDYWRPEVQQTCLENGRKTIDQARIAFEALGFIPKCHVEMGYPHNAIPLYTRKHQCTEVIMGSRGLSPISTFFVGSVATRVIQHVDCPVTLVK